MSQDNKNISLIIKSTQGDWSSSFSQTLKIQELINEVREHFGFASDGSYELRLESDPNNTLDPVRPIVSFQLKDGDSLIFTDLGIAVCL
ncbi:MAG: hypothetical protein IIA45_01010 [Bacteroidetes bacterium]|nr:hypothetical protein [Bacteroidota bacterium]